MADITVTPADVRPLPGAVARNLVADDTGDLGDLVYIDGTSGGAKLGDASAAGTAGVVGVVVAVNAEGKTSFVAGDNLSVVLWGPVQGFSGMTPGALHYLSDNAGLLADAAGTVNACMGIAWAADILLLNLHMDVPA